MKGIFKMPEVQTLLTGLAFGESPRWHEGRLWFSNWGMQEVVAIDLEGKSEVIVRVPTTIPFCIDWLPDGRLLVVSGREGRLLRQEPDGSLVTHADLTGLSDRPWNEIVVDGRGHIYVNSICFDFGVEDFRPAGDRPVAEVVAYYGGSRTAAMVLGAFQVLSAVGLLVFAACVVLFVRRTLADGGALADLTRAGGVLAALFLLASALLALALTRVAA